jgi:hypothetical protein
MRGGFTYSFFACHLFVVHDSDFALKNYRPPHPIGVKGGCSPQNNLEKLRGY